MANTSANSASLAHSTDTQKFPVSTAKLVKFDTNNCIQDSDITEGSRPSEFNFKSTEGEPEDQARRQLLLVENITSEWSECLINEWKVPLEMFESHLENSDWYSLQRIENHLPVLRSVSPTYVRFRFVATREVTIAKTSDTSEPGK
jgi:hypothetical protein